jgi:hypothetical protein
MSFYIKLGSTFYQLDATTEITPNFPATLTTNPVHSKRNISDHYFTEQPTLSIRGMVSDVKVAGNRENLSTSAYIDGLHAAMAARTPLSVKYRLDKEESHNWFITAFTPSQNQTYGFGGFRPGNDGVMSQVIQSFEISITLAQAIIAESATEDVEVSQSYMDALQKPSSKSSTVEDFGDSKKDQKDSERIMETIKSVHKSSVDYSPIIPSGGN